MSVVEIEETEQANKGGIGRRTLALLVAFALGGFLGAIFFPTVETRFVERRVEVPVRVVEYVDQVIEKRVEVPVEVVRKVGRDTDGTAVNPVESNKARSMQTFGRAWTSLRAGLTMEQVKEQLGSPDFIESNGRITWTYGKVGSAEAGFVSFLPRPTGLRSGIGSFMIGNRTDVEVVWTVDAYSPPGR
jgi:hypothetical protein